MADEESGMPRPNRVKFTDGSYKGLYGNIVGFTNLEQALIVRVDGYEDMVYCSVPHIESTTVQEQKNG